MTSSEELCLQWNDFQNIVRSAFADLRNDEDLTDVTLAFADGSQIKAHKLVSHCDKWIPIVISLNFI